MLGNMSRLGKGTAAQKNVNELVAAADAFRDRCAWMDAAESYRAALEMDPTLFHIWVQYGHALKGSGRLKEAEEAYGRALEGKDEADTHLQLGHLLKIANRKAEALDSYRKALQRAPNDPVIKREIQVCEQSLGSKFTQSSGAYHVYFDISDLIFYIGHHDNLTGIQRVQASIVLALLDVDLTEITVHFLTYVNSRASFYEIDQNFVVSLLYDLSARSEARHIQFDKMAARDGHIRDSIPLKASAIGENVLCLLGAAWVNRDYFLRVRGLKQTNSFRVIFLIHDLIPIFARETCDQGTAEVFANFLAQSYQVADGYLCVSQSTKNDLVRYFSGLGRDIGDVAVTKNGTFPSSYSPPSALQLIDPDLTTGNYVLFVSTIEGRKNHLAAFRAFEKLLSERSDVPYLICVGRLGWRAEEFLYACEASDFLRGKIKILTDVSDNELSALYKNCLLTIYPSLYEGWGLPVGEALGFGKICITSNVASLPEVGGDFAQYIDPLQPTKLADAIAYYLDRPAALEAARARIRSHYRPVEWKDVASRVLGACLASFEQPAKSSLPVIEPGREYPISAMSKLPPHLMGESMVEAISQARRRFFTPGLYSEADYILGQNVRIGDGWCEPESGFTWTRRKDAAIAFSISNPEKDRLAVYIAYQVTDPCIGATLNVEVARGQTLSYKITRRRSHIIIHVPRPATSTGKEDYFLRLKLNGGNDLDEKLRALDGRCPALAVRCFVVLPETNTAERLTILERLSFLEDWRIDEHA